MRQKIIAENYTDDDGNPAGGYARGDGIMIGWQNGPLSFTDENGETQRRKPNGAFVEGVLEAALQRLRHYQLSKFACQENADAIAKIEEALHCLDKRTADRESRGVEGTHQV